MRRFDELAAIAGGAVKAIQLATPDLEAIVIVVERSGGEANRYAGATSLDPPSRAAMLMSEVRLSWGADG